MKVEILVGSNYPDGDEEVRVESGDVVDVPDKIAKSLIKNNAAVKFDSKKKVQQRKREQEMMMVVSNQMILQLQKMKHGRSLNNAYI